MERNNLALVFPIIYFMSQFLSTKLLFCCYLVVHVQGASSFRILSYHHVFVVNTSFYSLVMWLGNSFLLVLNLYFSLLFIGFYLIFLRYICVVPSLLSTLSQRISRGYRPFYLLHAIANRTNAQKFNFPCVSS